MSRMAKTFSATAAHHCACICVWYATSPKILSVRLCVCLCFVHRCTMEEILWGEGAKKLSIQHFLLSLSVLLSFVYVMFYIDDDACICVMPRHFIYSRREKNHNRERKTTSLWCHSTFMRHQFYFSINLGSFIHLHHVCMHALYCWRVFNPRFNCKRNDEWKIINWEFFDRISCGYLIYIPRTHVSIKTGSC